MQEIIRAWTRWSQEGDALQGSSLLFAGDDQLLFHEASTPRGSFSRQWAALKRRDFHDRTLTATLNFEVLTPPERLERLRR